MSKLMKIHDLDNVFVVKNSILPGEKVEVGGDNIVFQNELGFGHKVAAKNLRKGDKIIKFGVPIGSATEDIPVGSHVHLHNLKSDYLSTYTLDHEFIKSE